MGLFGGIKSLVEWNELGLKLSRLQGSFQQWQKENPLTWQSAVLNALKHAAYSLAAVLGASALAWLAGPDAAGIITKDMSPTVAVAAIPLLHMGVVAIQNAIKVPAKG